MCWITPRKAFNPKRLWNNPYITRGFLSRGIGKNVTQLCMIYEKYQLVLKAMDVMKVPE